MRPYQDVYSIKPGLSKSTYNYHDAFILNMIYSKCNMALI